jgi:hypothetical protein
LNKEEFDGAFGENRSNENRQNTALWLIFIADGLRVDVRRTKSKLRFYWLLELLENRRNGRVSP